MASVLLKRCTGCREYTLQETCPRCGAKAKPNRPAKFSPEDNFGEYRRRLKKLDAAKGPGKSDSERVAGKQEADPATAAKPKPAKPAEGTRAGFGNPTKPPMAPKTPMDDRAAASATSASSAVPSGKKPKGA